MDRLSDSMMGLRAIESRLPPGFRFHPSDEELVFYYLRNRQQAKLQTTAAAMLVEVDLHACEPWDLPEVAKLGADEWYFFSFRERKYATGSRRNRATKQGYWKATGKDKAILREDGCRKAVDGARKTLVFYLGRAPNGRKSGWVMHEFRLLHRLHPKPKIQNMQQQQEEEEEEWVLCRVFRKGNNNVQAGQTAGIVGVATTTTPSSSSSAPNTTVHHLQVSPLPQQLQIDNKLQGLESLISSPAPIVMSEINQDRFSGIQLLQEDTSQHIFLDNEHMICRNGGHQQQLDPNGQQQHLLDLSVLQAPSFLELEQTPGDGAMEIISFQTTCGVLQDANNYCMQLY